MPTLRPSNSNIHVIARALLLQGDAVVVCHMKGERRAFFPGGHVENGELAQPALQRELAEELGITATIDSFIGACENIFSSAENETQHEINLVFTVRLAPDVIIKSTEDHIEFEKVPEVRFAGCDILPEGLKRGVMGWLTDGKSFFESNA